MPGKGRLVRGGAVAGLVPVVSTTSMWEGAILKGAAVAQRVEVWDGGTKVATLKTKSGTGSVSADWVTGLRRTFSGTFEPGAEKVIQPGRELRVFRGFNYGTGDPELVQLGCFPVQAADSGIAPGREFSVSGVQDRWQWVVQSTFLTGFTTVKGRTVKAELTRLFTETGQWTAAQVQNTISSNAPCVTQTWDTDRNQAIADLCKLVGAEAFISRAGVVILRDQKALGTPVVTLQGGHGGRLADATVSLDTSNVFNLVQLIPANTDPAFTISPIKVKVNDPNHPAYARPGMTTRNYSVQGGAYSSDAQALASLQKILTKISAPARQVTLQCLPDMSLNESDTARFIWPAGSLYAGMVETLQIQQIDYPMYPGQNQTVTCVSTRSDEDFTP